jgi:hypothetical protein
MQPDMSTTGSGTLAQWSKRVWAKLKCYLNPSYHFRKMREDFEAFGQYLVARKTFGQALDTGSLVSSFRGKLFGSFFLSGGFSLVGVAAGTYLQVITGNPWVGLFVPIVVGAIAATTVYQIVWWCDNWRLYHLYRHHSWERIAEFEKDLLPIHASGLRMAAIFALLTVPLNSILIKVLDLINPHIAQVVPISVVYWITDVVLLQSTFVRVMGDIFEAHAHTLAEKYRPTLLKASDNGGLHGHHRKSRTDKEAHSSK